MINSVLLPFTIFALLSLISSLKTFLASCMINYDDEDGNYNTCFVISNGILNMLVLWFVVQLFPVLFWSSALKQVLCFSCHFLPLSVVPPLFLWSLMPHQLINPCPVHPSLSACLFCFCCVSQSCSAPKYSLTNIWLWYLTQNEFKMFKFWKVFQKWDIFM